MKTSLFLALAISILLISCNSEKKSTPKKAITTNPYLGDWTRSFAMSAESTAQITYSFWKDSISYEMKGPMQLNYAIKKQYIAFKQVGTLIF